MMMRKSGSAGDGTARGVADRLRAIDERLAARMPVDEAEVKPSPPGVADRAAAPSLLTPVGRDHAIAGPARYCHGCGWGLHASASACPHCGADVRAAGRGAGGQAGRKSRIAAVLLALLLGGLGAHKFYLGRKGAGILYLLFAWTGVPLALGMIEALLYALMSDADFADKYG